MHLLKRPLFHSQPNVVGVWRNILSQFNSCKYQSSQSSLARFQAKIEDEGKSIAVNFPSSSSTFHASWLWSNDPSNVHHSSKQRKLSPGAYTGSRATQVRICTAKEALSENNNKKETTTEEGDSGHHHHQPTLPIPPPLGTCHPIASYEDEISRTQDDQQLLLRVEWDNPSSLPSYYDMNWLENWRYDKAALGQRRRNTEVVSANITTLSKQGEGEQECSTERQTIGGVPIFDFREIIPSLEERKTNQNGKEIFCSEKGGVHEILQAVFSKGAALLTNTPNKNKEQEEDPLVSQVARALSGGTLSHGTLYGDTFHVQYSPYAHNIAYTSIFLAPHQDLVYYESIPGLQLLHCAQFGDSIIGGESLLIDSMAAASAFRKIAPHHFETLVRVPATFVKQRQGANMTYQRPHIVLKEEGNLSLLDREIVTVNWAPAFEGPLACPPDRVEAYYAAYQAFERMVNKSARESKNIMNSRSGRNESREGEKREEGGEEEDCIFSKYAQDFTWQYRLKEGEIMVFNNRRMLHGRNSFHLKDDCFENGRVKSSDSSSSSSTLDRHLIGCYTCIDDTLCHYRVLQRERRGPDDFGILNVGNGTSLI